jgi:hypothetical protein
MNARTKVTLLTATAMIATVALTATTVFASAKCHSGDYPAGWDNGEITEVVEITKQVNVLSGRNERTTDIAHIINVYECSNISHTQTVKELLNFSVTMAKMKADPDGWAKTLSRNLPEGELKDKMLFLVVKISTAPTIGNAMDLVKDLGKQVREYVDAR